MPGAHDGTKNWRRRPLPRRASPSLLPRALWLSGRTVPGGRMDLRSHVLAAPFAEIDRRRRLGRRWRSRADARGLTLPPWFPRALQGPSTAARGDALREQGLSRVRDRWAGWLRKFVSQASASRARPSFGSGCRSRPGRTRDTGRYTKRIPTPASQVANTSAFPLF